MIANKVQLSQQMCQSHFKMPQLPLFRLTHLDKL